MRMIKVGDKYLGLVDDRGDALLFDTDLAQTRTIAGSISEGAHVAARSVKLKTRADQTGDSMRALADDVNNG